MPNLFENQTDLKKKKTWNIYKGFCAFVLFHFVQTVTI